MGHRAARVAAGSEVGFATGATIANLTALIGGADAVLRDAGSMSPLGLPSAPAIRFLAGDAVHTSVVLAGRHRRAGCAGRSARMRGAHRPEGLAAALAESADAPTIVMLQAGDVHSGAFDDFSAAIDLAQRHGAWMHVDGAFGLWAAACPTLRTHGERPRDADSWATDAHKTLNVPYDCGCRDRPR